ncbi:MAG: hypothetical protein K9L74_00080 [Candidatus Izimaplasma sp.]|nr:hypothetical protein [Candidatus Izimaplasma bacterium]
MQTRNVEFSLKNILFYIGGFFVLGLGVIFLLRSQLGAGAWDTVTANLRALINLKFPNFTLGFTSWAVSIILMIIILSYTKQLKLIFMLLPIFLVGVSLDFWDILIFGAYYPQAIAMKLLFYLLGAILLPFGLAMIIRSHFPAFVFDELMIMIADIFSTKNLTAIRIGIEILGISLGTLFGFLAGIGFGAVNVGSVIMALILPPILTFYLKRLGVIEHAKN